MTDKLNKLVKMAALAEEDKWDSEYIALINDMISKEAKEENGKPDPYEPGVNRTVLESLGPHYKSQPESHYPTSDAPTLSSRYCPDHTGTSVVRVADGVSQCPIDNKVYNWALGFKGEDGAEYPGGDVAAQTPESTNYGIPMRVFENRS